MKQRKQWNVIALALAVGVLTCHAAPPAPGPGPIPPCDEVNGWKPLKTKTAAKCIKAIKADSEKGISLSEAKELCRKHQANLFEAMSYWLEYWVAETFAFSVMPRSSTGQEAFWEADNIGWGPLSSCIKPYLGFWRSSGCPKNARLNGVVCQKDTLAPVNENYLDRCRETAFRYGDHCYEPVTQPLVNFHAGEEICRKSGGELASVDGKVSASERGFIQFLSLLHGSSFWVARPDPQTAMNNPTTAMMNSNAPKSPTGLDPKMIQAFLKANPNIDPKMVQAALKNPQMIQTLLKSNPNLDLTMLQAASGGPPPIPMSSPDSMCMAVGKTKEGLLSPNDITKEPKEIYGTAADCTGMKGFLCKFKAENYKGISQSLLKSIQSMQGLQSMQPSPMGMMQGAMSMGRPPPGMQGALSLPSAALAGAMSGAMAGAAQQNSDQTILITSMVLVIALVLAFVMLICFRRTASKRQRPPPDDQARTQMLESKL